MLCSPSWAVRVSRMFTMPLVGADIQGGGEVCDGNIWLWEISYFKCVRISYSIFRPL